MIYCHHTNAGFIQSRALWPVRVNGSLWLGLSNRAESGACDLQWQSNEERVFANWMPGHPDSCRPVRSPFAVLVYPLLVLLLSLA